MEAYKLQLLRHRLEKDLDFRGWMKEHWNALYVDIKNDTGLYPGFYDMIEQEYINDLDKSVDTGRR